VEDNPDSHDCKSAPLEAASTCTFHEAWSSNASVVGGLAEAATGPAGPASYRLEGTQTVVDARTQKPRCEVRGLRLRVGNSQPRQRFSQQGASTPRPRIATPRVRLIRTNPGQPWELLGARATAVAGARQQGVSSAWHQARGAEVSTGKSLRFLCPRNDPRGPWVVAERHCSGTNPGGGGALLAGFRLC